VWSNTAQATDQLDSRYDLRRYTELTRMLSTPKFSFFSSDVSSS
jgi:hypothetical protein